MNNFVLKLRKKYKNTTKSIKGHHVIIYMCINDFIKMGSNNRISVWVYE